MKNAIYAQSGGVTQVVNSSAYGVIKKCLNSKKINEIYVGINGINGILTENFLKMSKESSIEIDKLRFTPSSAFGSCRKKITNNEELSKISDIFKKFNIGYFFYNGGNDSMDTANKIDLYLKERNQNVKVIGIPKTIDNDLVETDHTPGYGSTAKYLATSMLEASLDVRAMSKDSTKVFTMETMGRNTGWLAASTALARVNGNFGPHIILIPERLLNQEKFLSKVENSVKNNGYCSIAVSEGLKNENGEFLSELPFVDTFGNKQMGNSSLVISKIILENLKFKTHTAIPDYLQRSSRHISSYVDVREAIECGMKAVDFALDGISGKMITINRLSNTPYHSEYNTVNLSLIANGTKFLYDNFISDDGMDVTDDFIEYAEPLIEGEYPPHFDKGIPIYSHFKIK